MGNLADDVRRELLADLEAGVGPADRRVWLALVGAESVYNGHRGAVEAMVDRELDGGLRLAVDATGLAAGVLSRCYAGAVDRILDGFTAASIAEPRV